LESQIAIASGRLPGKLSPAMKTFSVFVAWSPAAADTCGNVNLAQTASKEFCLGEISGSPKSGAFFRVGERLSSAAMASLLAASSRIMRKILSMDCSSTIRKLSRTYVEKQFSRSIVLGRKTTDKTADHPRALNKSIDSLLSLNSVTVMLLADRDDKAESKYSLQFSRRFWRRSSVRSILPCTLASRRPQRHA